MIGTGYSNNIFEYSNRSYLCDVILYTKGSDSSNDTRLVCDASAIEEFVYDSSLNDLVITGHIIYVDRYGTVDKLMNQYYCYCKVIFGLNNNKVDGSLNVIKPDKDKCFMHQFIVNNISVIERENSVIKYRIDLVSLNWFKCKANLQFSNYDKEPEPIFDIIKRCMIASQLKIDDETFDKVKTNVKLNYISQSNDNLFSCIKYLMHKLYYMHTQKDDSLKFFLYDWANDKYRLMDLKKKDTTYGSYSTVMSFFKTNNEVLIQQEPTNVGSFYKSASKTDTYSSLFDINLFQYFHDTNKIENFPVQSQTLCNYLNNKIDTRNYELKYQPSIHYPQLKHQTWGSYWNSNYDLYDDAMQFLFQNNTIILNITGEVRRQAGSFNTITIDRSMTNTTSEDKKELEKLKLKYKAFEGIWIASKVRSIVSPANQTFRQQVVLFRNFIPTLKAAK